MGARQVIMAIRVLGPHERGRFSPEAWGHLLALSGSGSLNPAELEHIIERALIQIDGRIALDDLRSLMEGAGFGEQGEGDQHQTVH
jgi:Smg protein